MRRNFEYSCDQATFRMLLSNESTVTVMEAFLIQVPFLPLVLNKSNNDEHEESYEIFIPLKIRSTQNTGVTFLFCLGHGLWCYFLMQVRNQKFFKAGEVSWKNTHEKHTKERPCWEKLWGFFSKSLLKPYFEWKI